MLVRNWVIVTEFYLLPFTFKETLLCSLINAGSSLCADWKQSVLHWQSWLRPGLKLQKPESSREADQLLITISSALFKQSCGNAV